MDPLAIRVSQEFRGHPDNPVQTEAGENQDREDIRDQAEMTVHQVQLVYRVALVQPEELVVRVHLVLQGLLGLRLTPLRTFNRHRGVLGSSKDQRDQTLFWETMATWLKTISQSKMSGVMTNI